MSLMARSLGCIMNSGLFSNKFIAMIRKLVVLGVIVIAVFAVAGQAQAATCTLLTVNLRNGSSDALIGSQVSSLIHFLQESGHISSAVALTPGRMTFGPQTLAGLKSFQVSERLAPTGVANLATRFRIFARSCGAGSITPTPTVSGWQAGSPRTVTWNRALIRAANVELALKKIDTSARYVIAAATSNDGSELLVLPSSLPAGYYDLEVRFVFTFGGKNYALGYPAAAARQVNVAAVSYSGGGGVRGESNAQREEREAREREAAAGSFDTLSAPGILVNGAIGTLNVRGTNIARYDVIFTCASSYAAAYHSLTGEVFCASSRPAYNLGTISISGSEGSLNFQAVNPSVSQNGIMTLTVRAYNSAESLVDEKSVTITVTPYGGVSSFGLTVDKSGTLSSGTSVNITKSYSNLARVESVMTCSAGISARNISNQELCNTGTKSEGVPSFATGDLLYATLTNSSAVTGNMSYTARGYNSAGTLIGSRTISLSVAPASAQSSLGALSVSGGNTILSGTSANVYQTFSNVARIESDMLCGLGVSAMNISSSASQNWCNSGIRTETQPSTATNRLLSFTFTNSGQSNGTAALTTRGYNASGALVGTQSTTLTVTPAPSALPQPSPSPSGSFSYLSLPSIILGGTTGTLYASGSGISHYTVDFNCGSLGGAYIYHPTSGELYCSFQHASITVAGPNASLSFLAMNTSGTAKSVSVTVRAYRSDGSLVDTKSADVRVNSASALAPSSTQYGAVGALLQQFINLILNSR
ncbi:MAG: hemagluttinin domain protein [Parcubacteria group bacterium GW2011_GWC1_51_35]|nr:MAG: hemagluttinin domain protein [Parcubacteria group bacterium GW2011_GWC1_51_35]